MVALLREESQARPWLGEGQAEQELERCLGGKMV